MSTRCQVRIIGNGTSLNLYHHFDGDFNGVGKELSGLLEPLRRGTELDAGLFTKALMSKGGYDVTFRAHGDIDYFYQLDFDRRMFLGWQVRWSEHIWGGQDWRGRLPDILGETVKDLL